MDWLLARPIAHRGLHTKAMGIIENTRTAFEKAMAGNYTIECDLQLTADGEAVVFHDHTLDRLTGEKGYVASRTTHELQSIVITNSADRIQSLTELLEQVAGAVPLVIELKSHWNGNIALALRALELLEGYKGQYCLMSFDPDLIAAVARHSPQTIRGITADRFVHPEYDPLPPELRANLRKFKHLKSTRPHFVSFYYKQLPYAPVQKLRNAGMPIITWTIKNKKQEAFALQHSDQVTFEGYAA
jgi:glycerophosphoryl diester phosphodiesterase